MPDQYRISSVHGTQSFDPPRGLKRRQRMVSLFVNGWAVGDIAAELRVSYRFVEQVVLRAWRDDRLKLNRVRKAGSMLANCAYNLKQRSHLYEEERRSLAESQQAWDAEWSVPTAGVLRD